MITLRLPLCLFFAFVLFLSGCESTRDDGPFAGSHTGAEDSEEFIQDAEIEVTAKAAIQFAILSLHEGDEAAATQLKEYLDGLTGNFPSGDQVAPDALIDQISSELNSQQKNKLSKEIAAASRHLSGKLDTNSVVDTAQTYTAREALIWMRDAADWSSKGYNYDIVCTSGIALGNHEHNAGTGIRIGL